MTTTVCLFNPRAAGGRSAALREPLGMVLAQRQIGLVVPETVAAAQAQLAALPPGSRVIVAGGDGTVQQVLPALLAHGHRLALLPTGTGNDLARALGLRGLDWRDALTRALTAPTRPLDVGLVDAGHGPQPFLSSLTVGFDAAVGARAHEAPRWLRGMPRYTLAALRELVSLPSHRVRWQADDGPVHETQALLASTLNTPTYASGMRAAPAARPDDGWLDLVIAGRFGRLGALAMMPLLMAGWHGLHPRVTLARYRELLLEADTALPLALDGEPIAASRRLQVRVQPAALAVVAAAHPTE
ncbi:MAG: hypothetical protein LCH73_00145 [Proteobacteria bacterium]|nr:hypothetical protein [Pseudomonadota bacterium]